MRGRKLGWQKRNTVEERTSRYGSDVQGPQVRDAFLRQFPSLFDEVVFHTADPGGFEGFHPVDAALADWNLRVARGR